MPDYKSQKGVAQEKKIFYINVLSYVIHIHTIKHYKVTKCLCLVGDT